MCLCFLPSTLFLSFVTKVLFLLTLSCFVVIGQATFDDSSIYFDCVKKCEFKSFNDSIDEVAKCQLGCQKSRAFKDISCPTLCNNTAKSSANQIQVAACFRGCRSFRQSLCSELAEKLDPLPQPHPVANSIGNQSLLLEWHSHPQINLNYTIQYRYEDYMENNTWFDYIETKDTFRRINTSFIENLKPFTGYRFRLIYQPAPDCPPLHSMPSLVLRTLPWGRPSLPPEITKLEAATPNEIFVSWKATQFPNDHIIAYVLYLYEYAGDEKRLRPISTSSSSSLSTSSPQIPYSANLALKYQYNQSTPLQYTFNGLKASTLYTIGLSSINSQGEGPLTLLNITTPFFNETEGLTDLTVPPYLLVTSARSVFNYTTDLMDGSSLFELDPNDNVTITSIDIHIKRKLVLIASSNGTIWQIDYHADSLVDSKPKVSMLPLPIPGQSWPSSIHKIAIDWVHDIVYMLFDSSIGCFNLNHLPDSFSWCLTGLTNGTRDLHVDPINRYLYWSISNPLGGSGLYRISLFNLAITKSVVNVKREIIRFLREPLIKVFTIDYSRKRIYFPHNETIWSSSMDGTNVTNIRPNVVSSRFKDVAGLVHHDDAFYWISGTELCKEEANPEGEEIYHNSFNLDEKLISLVLVHPTVQPTPPTYSSADHGILIIQPSATADLKTLCWTILGSLIFFVILLFAAKKVMKSQTNEKEVLKDSERGHERNLISLAQLPNHPHEDNRLYLPGDIGIENELSSIRLISPTQFKKTAYLGQGAFGEVFEGLFTDPELVESLDAPVKVAIKTLKSGSSEQEKDNFIQEAKMMGNFKHPHILKLLGVCLDPGNNSILLELMEGGDLQSYLRSMRPTEKRPCQLTLDDLLSICVDVAKGCQYLEAMHFVHRDLAARNCLVSSYNRETRIVKIGDFGLARDVYKNDYYRKAGEGLLPVRWMAPESLVDAIFTTQSDVWSFGVILWEVMTLAERPYPARNNQEVLKYVRSGGRPERPPNCIDEMFLLMNQCWEYDPSMRPTFMACLNYLEELRLKVTSDGIITSFSNHSYYTNGASSELRFFTGGNSNLNSTFNSTMDTATTYCASSRAESIHSKYLNISVDHEGYEIPILGCSGACGMDHQTDQHCESQPRNSGSHQHRQMFASLMGSQRKSGPKCSKSMNGSPPPTYSQLFLSSSAASAWTDNGSPENQSEVNSLTDQSNSETNHQNHSQTGSSESLDEVPEVTSVTTALLKPIEVNDLMNQPPIQIYRNLSDLMYVNDIASLLEPISLPLTLSLPSPSRSEFTTNSCSKSNCDQQTFKNQHIDVDNTTFTNLYTNWSPLSMKEACSEFLESASNSESIQEAASFSQMIPSSSSPLPLQNESKDSSHDQEEESTSHTVVNKFSFDDSDTAFC
ncbi:proto-oncogene tyrosine-protein kinase ROS-like [Tetranychus urticae]|uniref:proto-oncogene tyrosine-protein kinase ROS-like n=1 Tax=Tetranychus urticae TaxID=32264 RepID=UPI00077BB639|nr:proto-oncogene tyrosine-protein kinase ROS-like [Tetranychus urticae]